MKILKQRTRIVILTILLIITVVGTFSYISLEKIQNILIDKSFSSLTTSRDIKKQQVKDFFARKIIDIEAVARSLDIASLINNLNDLDDDLDNDFVFNNQEFLANYTKKHGYLEMFILCVEKGNVLYHQKKLTPIKTSIENETFKENRLSEIWKKTVESKRVVFLDMKKSAEKEEEPSLLMGTRIYMDGKFKAVLVFKISNEGLSKIMNFRKGYGTTQEDYLLGPDNLRRSESNVCQSTHNSKLSSSSVIKIQCDSKAVTKALARGKSQEIIVNYNGNRILSAYSPININQDLQWGILSEIDEKEVLIVLQSIRDTIIIYAVMFVFLISAIVLFVVYRMFELDKKEIDKSKKMNQNLRSINKKLAESEYEVILKNEQLEIKVDEVITKNKQNQNLLFQQSKMASMGEMIGNIAHQWRQPLNALSALNIRLGIKYQRGKLSDEEMSIFAEKSNQLIQGMSHTIDDFRNFFSPKKSSQWFYVEEAIEEALHFIESSYNINNIYLMNYTSTNIEIKNHKNELIQVLLNIFNNSKDAIKENNTNNGMVSINVSATLESLKIMIQDNGGGIKQEIIDRVFEPYFTTKFQDEGTGIGLYMSKMIIEESMQGKLKLENSADGVLTTIELSITPKHP
ncbi:MAG: Putative two-component sensor histidine kinase [uncultured Sulfurovum sp.]|uniref:histidine kinase n=1 Tax=uncultured Sulfurovum sp. TaxID=269237 RepID=A0A6S6SS68_9BACT|nr:MAG: Putative two-component sensor histidine kinase [uncultured Sulfurovum sp.]